MNRTKAKRSVDEYNKFYQFMSTGNISNAIRSLTEDAKSGYISLTHKVDKKTILDVLREKHPEPRKAKMNYLVSNEHPNVNHTVNPYLKNSSPQWLESLP